MAEGRPILIGQNNPVSLKPGHELYPLPKGCTGNRLWQMLAERTGATMRQYVDAFERRNLVVAQRFDRQVAKANAALIYAELWGSGRTVVLLGQEVVRAFGIPPVLLHPQVIGGTTWRQIPHPSGLNRWYNDAENVRLVGLLLEELYTKERESAT